MHNINYDRDQTMTVFEITSSEISLRPRFSQTEIDLDKIWYRGRLCDASVTAFVLGV